MLTQPIDIAEHGFFKIKMCPLKHLAIWPSLQHVEFLGRRFQSKLDFILKTRYIYYFTMDCYVFAIYIVACEDTKCTY